MAYIWTPLESSIDSGLKSHFKLLELIGVGSYGEVYKALDSRTNILAGVKLIELDTSGYDESSTAVLESILREIYILQQVSTFPLPIQIRNKSKHNNNIFNIDADDDVNDFINDGESNGLLHYYGTELHVSKLWIATEFMQSGSVFDLICSYKHCRKFINKASSNLDESIIAAIISGVVNSLITLHNKYKLVHRDIKCSNILLNKNGDDINSIIKLADFGLTISYEDIINDNSLVGSPYWIAPEIILSSNSNNKKNDFCKYKCDVWSLGITVLELFYDGSPPYSEYTHSEALKHISNFDEDPPELKGDQFSDIAKDFVRCCLQKNPLKRTNLFTLSKHKFLTKSKKHLLTQLLEKTDSYRTKMIKETAASNERKKQSNRKAQQKQLSSKHNTIFHWDFGRFSNKRDFDFDSEDEDDDQEEKKINLFLPPQKTDQNNNNNDFNPPKTNMKLVNLLAILRQAEEIAQMAKEDEAALKISFNEMT